MRPTTTIGILVLLALTAFLDGATDAEFGVDVPGRLLYVATSGDDAAPGSRESPLRTISRAAGLAAPGDAVLVNNGIYRERVAPRRGGEAGRPIVYKARPGMQVVISGSDPWSPTWTRLRPGSPVWWAVPDPKMFTDDCYWTPANPFRVPMAATPGGRDGRPEAARGIAGADPTLTFTLGQVFVAGGLLPQVGSLAEVERQADSWWFEAATGRIHVRLGLSGDPTSQPMEITTRRRVFAPHVRGLGYINVIGFVIERCGNQFPVGFWDSRDTAQAGALGTRAGHHWEIRGNLVRQANGIGIDIGGEGNLDGERTNQPRPPASSIGSHLIEGNWVVDNGVCGIAGSHATRMVIRGNVVARNNALRFNGVQRYEQAGIKLHTSIDSLIESNFISDNHTYGIYLDSGGSFAGARISRNLIVGNDTAGIHLEQSNLPADSVLVDTNVVVGNGGAAIYLHGTAGISILQNLFAGSVPQGFMRGAGVYVHLSKAFGGLSDTSRICLQGNVVVGNTVPLDLNYPTACAAQRVLKANLYDAATSARSFLINPYAAEPTPAITDVYSWIHGDLSPTSPGITAFTGNLRAQLTFAEWQRMWAKHVEAHDGISISDPGVRLTWNAATTSATLTLTPAGAALAVPHHPRLSADFSGQPLPAGVLKPGPWQGVVVGANLRQCWTGIPIEPPRQHGSNSAPRISPLADQTVLPGGSTGPMGFTVGDAESVAGNLVVTARSSNSALVPDSGIELGGSGAARWLTVTPSSGQTGQTAITVTVSDGARTASEALVLKVNIRTNTSDIIVNFQPAAAQIPANVFVDSGKTYGKRGNGCSYGWWTNAEDNTRDRNESAAPDQLHDTLIYVRPGGTWEIGLPNGTYEVRLVAGDLSFVSGRQQFFAEGIPVMDEMASTSTQSLDRLVTVTISDGRLTITHGVHGEMGKLCFLEIHSVTANG